MTNSLQNASWLITGASGSFGKKALEILLSEYSPRRIGIFSRDELKQFEMREQFPERKYPCLRYFLGDVRDADRLRRAFDGVEYVIHAAALKQVPAAEYNPIEAIKTNVHGAINVIDAAIDRGVKKVVALSTDKAANPVNLYGATKLCSDKLFVNANNYSGSHPTRFSVVRYGNVMGSRGSVIPFFTARRKTGVLPITDPRMTRFWITLDQGVRFVLNSFVRMHGGELYVPKIPSMKITDLATAMAPECKQEIVGIRPGEKLHEIMITEDDARHTREFEDHYAILPEPFEGVCAHHPLAESGKPCPEGFHFSSDSNKQWITGAELMDMLIKHKMIPA